jgi:rhodanese-related sulfurtransferase
MEAHMLNAITLEQLKQRLSSASPPVLLEALPERYYAKEHLPGARLFPHDQVEQLAPQVIPNKGASIVVYCASVTCQNSHSAAHHLMRLGYSDVSVYAGGKKEWAESGLPLEASAAAAFA